MNGKSMAKAKYEILEHKADLKIRIFGADQQELFKNALLGMQEGLKAEIKAEASAVKKEIKVSSPDLNSLLVDFLSEVNYLNDVHKEIYTRVEFSKFSDTELEAEISGKKAENFGLAIKGVTYHGLEIFQKDDGIWEATVLFDI